MTNYASIAEPSAHLVPHDWLDSINKDFARNKSHKKGKKRPNDELLIRILRRTGERLNAKKKYGDTYDAIINTALDKMEEMEKCQPKEK